MNNIEEMFTKEEMIDVNKHFSREEYLRNPRIALYNVMKNVNKIYAFKKEALSDEVINYVINNNLYSPVFYPDCDECLKVYKLAYYLVKQNPDLLSRVPEYNLTEELINMALDEKFELQDIHPKLLKNQTFLKVAVERDFNVLNQVNKEDITDELIEIAKSKKYVFELIGKRKNMQLTHTSFGEDEYLEAKNNLHLLNYDELVISSFKNGYESIIFEENISLKNKYYDYMVTKALTDNIPITNLRNTKLFENEIFKKYIYDNLFKTENSRKLLKKYLDDKYMTGNLELTSYILSDNFVEMFGLLMVDMIMKYLVCPNSEFKIDVVLKLVDAKTLKQILDKFIDKDGQHVLLQMQKVINYLALNPDLIKEVITLNDTELSNLKFVIFENNDDIKINNKEDIKNINRIRYDYYNSLEINVIDKIFKYLTGYTNTDFRKFRSAKLTSDRYKRLLNKSGINNDEDSGVISYLEYLEELSMTSEEELFNIWSELKNNGIKPIMFDYVIDSYKKRYFNYFKTNLTRIRGNKPNYFIDDDIPVFEFNGQDFSFVIHVFNAFEARSDEVYNVSSMFKNTVGRSYISTSYINQHHYKGTSHGKKNSIFIFEDFSFENLIGYSFNDLCIDGNEKNSLDVTLRDDYYVDMFEISCLTRVFNEFAFYRINNNGYRLLPSAVLCYDEITEAQKNLSRYYQIPVVLIKTEAYKDLNERLFEQYLKEINAGDINHIEELIGLSYKLKHEFNYKEIQSIFDKVPDEDVDSVYECLKMYNYNINALNSARHNCHKIKKLNIEENKN